MKDKASFIPVGTILIINVVGILLLLLSFTGLFNPIYSLADLITRNIKSDIKSGLDSFNETIGVIGNVYSIKNERDELKQKILLLEEENTRLKVYAEQIKVLEEQIGSGFSQNFELVAAEIIYLDPKEEGRAKVNKGKDDGVSEGDVVVLNSSAVGEVINVSGRISEVLLISSPESNVPVVSQTNATRGIMRGEFGGKLVVDNIVQTDKLENGESFVTLGVNSSYPAGLFVGRVEEISEVQAETIKSAVLENLLNFQTLKYVFILKTIKE